MRPFLLAPLVFLVAAPSLAAQGPLVLEARGGVALPLASFRTGAGEAGPTLDVQFLYRRSANRAVYLGFHQRRFGCAPTACEGTELVDTGWVVGTKLDLGAAPGLSPWLRLGVLFDRVEGRLRAPHGVAGEDEVSDLAVGGEVGAGVVVRLGGRVSMSPGARYALVNTRFDEGGLLRLRYLVADLGVTLGF